MTFSTREINAPDAIAAAGRYAQAFEVKGGSRTLYVSGQIPAERQGGVPAEFDAQARLVWRNVEAQLRAADMGIANIAKVTTFLSNRAYGEANKAVRDDALCGHRPASTVVIAGIFDPAWLLEVEVIAVS